MVRLHVHDMMEESNATQPKQHSGGGLAALHKSALKNLSGGSGLGGLVRPASSKITSASRFTAADKKRARTAEEEPCSSNGTCASDGDVASLRQELDSLKRRKALLAGEVEQLRSGCVGASEGNGASSHGNNTTCTVADELEHVRSRALANASQTSSESRKSYSIESTHDDKWSDREYLHKYDDRDGVGLIVGRKRSRQDVLSSLAAAAVTPSALGGDANDEIDCAISEAIEAARREVRARTLAEHMHTVRTQRRIAAAHRLAGVSALPLGGRTDNDNVLGVRIDVCKDGSFNARYHVFFDIVMVLDNTPNSFFGGGDASDGNDSKQCFRTVFRLAQHTLPTPGVSLKPILCRHFGSDGMLPIDEDDGDASQNKEAITNTVRRCIGDLSDACHSFITRRDACLYLQGKESMNKRHDDPLSSDRQFKNVAYNDSFDRISFDLYCLHPRRSTLTGGKDEHASLAVQLIYDNQMTARPTSMRIKTLQSPSEKNISSKDEVEQSNKNEGGGVVDACSDAATLLIEELKEALLSDPLPFVFEQQFDGLLSKCTG